MTPSVAGLSGKHSPHLSDLPGGTAGLPTAGDVLELFDCGLLTHHYFSVVQHGAQVPPEAVSRTRMVLNSKVAGLADGETVLRRYAGGATILLHEPGQWHDRIHELVRETTAHLDGEIRTTAVLIPAGAPVSWPSDPYTQRFVVALSGTAADDEQAVTVGPAQVLYVPPARPCTMRAGAGGALLLTITVRETSPAEIADQLIERFLRERADRAADRATCVRDELMAFLRDASGEGGTRP